MNHFDKIVPVTLTRQEIESGAIQNRRVPGRPKLGKGEIDVARRLRSETADRLRQRRQELGYSVAHVARAAGVSGARYNQWEKQFGKLAQSKYLNALADILGVHPEWISDGVDLPAAQHGNSEVRSLPTIESWLTATERKQLAIRAQGRRKSLKLKPHEIAAQIGMDVKKFGILERCITARPNLDVESKWELVLQVPIGWLRNLELVAPTIEQTEIATDFASKSAASVAEEIRAISCWLSRESMMRRTSEYQSLKASERRSSEIFALRYGVEGEDASILQAIGEKFGVTRERIRQITATMEERSAHFKGETPFLDRLEAELIPFLPQAVDKLDVSFRVLLGGSLSLEGVDRFTREVLGRSIVSLTEKPANMSLGWGVIAVDPKTHDPAVLRAIRDVALALIRSSGAAQINFVAGAAGGVLKRGITPDEASLGCSLVTGFEWLAEEDGWFWFGTKWENRLLTVTKKVLAVAKRRVDIEDIHEAMARSRRSKYGIDKHKPYTIDAPHTVLVEVLKRVPWIEVVQHDDFRLAAPVALESILSDVELALHNLLSTKGGVAARYIINKELLETDRSQFGHIALQVALDSSPIMRRIDFGIFALRGAALTPESLASASAAVGGDSQHMKNHPALTLNSEGYIAVEFEMRPYMINSRYLEVPVRLATLIPEGDYQLDGFEEQVTYSVLPSGSRRFLKLTSKLIRSGFGAGDWVLLHVNPKTKQIRFERALKIGPD